MHLFTRSKIVAASALLTSLFVVGAAVSPAQASAPPQAAASTAVKLTDATTAPDQAGAAAVAQKYNHPVVDESKTTETSQVSALPDGTMQLVVNSLPVRVHRGNVWIAADATLQQAADGAVVPVATSVAVEFSGGGSGFLARVQTDSGKWVTESWPYGDLPTPTLSGATATYSEVFPGVDLNLTASVTGMSEVFVVKNATAIRDPRVARLSLAVSGASVSTKSDGQTVASASDGSVLTSSAPVWWDSSKADADASGPAGGDFAAPVQHSVAGKTLSLDTRSVAADSVTYPVYIDPDWTGGVYNRWFIDRGYPTTSYLNPSTRLKLGYASAALSTDGVNHLARMFFLMDTSGVAGKHILAAHFNTTETYSGSCTPMAVELWQVGAGTPGASWNNTTLGWISNLDTQTVAYGRSACPASAVGFNALSGVQAAAAANATSLTLGLKATAESDSRSYKEFSPSASLTVNYNSPPNTPQNPSFTSPERACSTSATNPSFVNNAAQPLTMAVTVTDPDSGANVNTAFHVVNGTTFAAVATYSAPQQAQGVLSAQIPMNALAPGLYAWHAQAGDNIDLSASFSPYCYFQVQNTGPGLPSVTEVTSSAPVTVVTPATGVVGDPISVRFTASTAGATAEFGYWWTSGAAVSPSPIPPVTFAPLRWDTGAPMCPARVGAEWFVCADSSGVATVVVAPTDAPQSTLWVVAYDGAGNISTNTVQPNDSSTAAGLQVSTAADVDHVQYSSASGGDFWNADDFNGVLPSTAGPGIPDTNATHTTSDMAVSNTDMVAPMPLTSPLASTNVLAFGGQVQLWTSHYTSGNYVTATFWQRPDNVDYWTPPIDQGFMKPYPATPSGTAASAPTGMTTLYNCTFTTTGVVMNSVSDTCEDSGATPTPIGFIWTAASSSDHATYPLYRCGPTGFDVHDLANCTGPVVTTLLGYVEADADRGTVTDSTEMTDDSLHGFTYSAWFNSNPSGQDFSNVPVGTTALAYASTFYLTESSTGTWNLCWPDWGPPAYEPCVEGPAVTPGVWTFVSVEWDPVNSQLRLIINGQVNSATVASRTTQSLMFPSNHVFTIGSTNADNSDDDGGARAWNGYIADVSGFPGVADSTELANLMNENPPQ